MAEVQSESSVRRVSLQEAGEKGGPWPFILWMDPHDAEKATLFRTLFLEGKGRREMGGVVVCECFECCSRAGRNSGPATKIVA
jgi:hypothetical protein